jgi:hypothetical protein
MSDNNGWPGKPGVPLNPEKEGPHWLRYEHDGYVEVSAFLWERDGYWVKSRHVHYSEWPGRWTYLGPALTPAEVDARIATARKDALAEIKQDTDELIEQGRQDGVEQAARRLEELHKNHQYNPKTGEGSEHNTGYYRALAEGAAHIRALAKGEGQ